MCDVAYTDLKMLLLHKAAINNRLQTDSLHGLHQLQVYAAGCHILAHKVCMMTFACPVSIYITAMYCKQVMSPDAASMLHAAGLRLDSVKTGLMPAVATLL